LFEFWSVDKPYTITKHRHTIMIVAKTVKNLRQNFCQNDRPRLPQLMSSG